MPAPAPAPITCEVWIEFEYGTGEARTTACTVLGPQSFVVRPIVGEGLSFFPDKTNCPSFKVMMAWGAMPAGHISTEIERISHFRGPGTTDTSFQTQIQCQSVHFESLEDVRVAVQFLTSQHGFEVDPYGVNELGEPGEA